jgi:hypothetical protein
MYIYLPFARFLRIGSFLLASCLHCKTGIDRMDQNIDHFAYYRYEAIQ